MSNYTKLYCLSLVILFLTSSCSRIPDQHVERFEASSDSSFNRIEVDTLQNIPSLPSQGAEFVSSYYTKNFRDYNPYSATFIKSEGNIEIGVNSSSESFSVSNNTFFTRINPVNPIVTSYPFEMGYEEGILKYIRIGDIYYLNDLSYKKNVSVSNTSNSIKNHNKTKNTNVSVSYKVQKGDTWFSIAKKFSTSVPRLQNANKNVGLNTGTNLIIK